MVIAYELTAVEPGLNPNAKENRYKWSEPNHHLEGLLAEGRREAQPIGPLEAMRCFSHHQHFFLDTKTPPCSSSSLACEKTPPSWNL